MPESMAGADQEGSEEGVSPHGLTLKFVFRLIQDLPFNLDFSFQTVQSVS